MEDQKKQYWYIFYDDKLLLQKKGEGFAIPFGEKAPLPVARMLPVTMPDGTEALSVRFMIKQGKHTSCFIGTSTAVIVLFVVHRRYSRDRL